MMSEGSHVPTSRVTACSVSPVGLAADHRLIQRRLATDTVQTHPGKHAVVVAGQRPPPEFVGAAVEAKSVPPADQGAAMHGGGSKVGAQMRTTARADAQLRLLIAPGDQFDAGDAGAQRSTGTRHRGSRRTHTSCRSVGAAIGPARRR